MHLMVAMVANSLQTKSVTESRNRAVTPTQVIVVHECPDQFLFDSVCCFFGLNQQVPGSRFEVSLCFCLLVDVHVIMTSVCLNYRPCDPQFQFFHNLGSI